MIKQNYIILTDKILPNIIKEQFYELNNYMDAEATYNYIKNIKSYIEDFLDIFYENKLTNYIIDDNDIKSLNKKIKKLSIYIADKIIHTYKEK